MEKKLYKSRRDVKLDGVCSGIANYFGFDPTVIRLAWVILGFITAAFPGILLYIACMFVMPREPETFIDEFKNGN